MIYGIFLDYGPKSYRGLYYDLRYIPRSLGSRGPPEPFNEDPL